MRTAPMRRITPVRVLVAVAVFAAVGAFLGWPPAFALLAAIASVGVVAARRLGLGLAVALGFAVWQVVTFASFVIAYLLNVRPGGAVVCAALALGGVAIVSDSRVRRTDAESHVPRGVVLASLSGGVVWIGSVLLGAVTPNGAGLTWATYRDSAFDVFGMRMIMWSGGQVPAGGNPRPLEHVMSASFLPTDHVVDASPQSLEAQLLAHAIHWSVLIALACFLAGIVSALFAVRAGWQGARIVVVSGAVSLGMLAIPITGLIIDYGQINGHLVVIYLLASTVAAYEAVRAPALATAVLMVLTGCIAICWTPFAAVPGVLAILVAWSFRAAIKAKPEQSLLFLGGAGVILAWLVSSFALPEIITILTRDSSANQSSVTAVTITGFTNPYWWPLSIAIVAVTILAAILLRGLDRTATVTSLGLVAGLTLGMAPLMLARGSLTGALEYYPAKYLSLATVGLAPLTVALVLRATLPQVAKRSRVAVAAASGVLIVLCVLAPLPSATPKYGFAPLDVITGDRWGSHADVAGRALGLTTNESRTVLWRSGDPFETPVNLLLAAIDRDQYDWKTLSRAAIRAPSVPGSADDACLAALSPGWTLTLVTRDPNLASEIAQRCPHLEITVRVEEVTR